MKRRLLSFLFVLFTVALSAQTAEVQIIHNSPAPTVDIYANGVKLLSNFEFRQATDFVEVPAEVDVDLAVAPAPSQSANEAIANFTVNLDDGEKYVAIATGIVGDMSNPFDLKIITPARDAANDPANVDVTIYHGSTDAPVVEVYARDVSILTDDLAYSNNTDYLELPAGDYILDVTPGENNQIIVASYSAPLSALEGGAAVVFASGFLDPETPDDPTFGLFAALPNGDVLELPQVENTASLQVIHNSPSPTVDIWVDGQKTIDSLTYRSATEFLQVPAGQNIQIGVAPHPSDDINDVIATFNLVLAPDQEAIAMATGILGDMDTPFFLLGYGSARSEGSTPDNVDVAIYHGATDAPAVDVSARNVGPLVDTLEYGEFSPYQTIPAEDYTLDVRPTEAPEVIAASFLAPLSGLEGQAVVVFASGFLSPLNPDDPGFGLFAALPNGDVIELPAVQNTARLQVIHNSPSPTVDVWLNGTKLLDSFTYRSATPFIDAPAGVPLEIGVAPHPSNDPSEIIATFDAILAPDETYVAIATGIVGDMTTPFDLKVINPAQEVSTDPANVDFTIYHGSTDAPTVDILARGVATLADDLSYGENTDYLSIPAIGYIVDVTPADDNNNVLFSYDVNLNPIAGSAGVAFASGFLDPPTADDPSFALFVALADGTVIELPVMTTSTYSDISSSIKVIPTIASQSQIELRMNGIQGRTSVAIVNSSGQVVDNYVFDTQENFSRNIDVSLLDKGTYILRLTNESKVGTKIFVVQ